MDRMHKTETGSVWTERPVKVRYYVRTDESFDVSYQTVEAAKELIEKMAEKWRIIGIVYDDGAGHVLPLPRIPNAAA